MITIQTLLVASVIAAIASQITGIATKKLITERKLPRAAVVFGTSGSIAYYFGTTLLEYLIITTAPIWLMFALVMLFAFVGGLISLVIFTPLVKRGYLGNHRKWLVELQDDDEFQAAILLLEANTVSEIAHTSADKDHFRNQIIEEAGIPTDDA